MLSLTYIGSVNECQPEQQCYRTIERSLSVESYDYVSGKIRKKKNHLRKHVEIDFASKSPLFLWVYVHQGMPRLVCRNLRGMIM